jgi:hypothetical protein
MAPTQRVARSALFTAVLIVVFSTARPAHALIINATFDDAGFAAAGFSPSKIASIHSAFNFAASEFQNLYTDPIHVNITVQTGNVGLGQSQTFLTGPFTYAQVKTLLTNDQTAHPSADGATSIANLPASVPIDRFFLTTAQAKALGQTADNLSTDGIFTFDQNQTYTFDPNNRQVPGAFDFIGVAEHEISEIMGRIPGLGAIIGGQPSLLVNDLFRFAPGGIRSFDSLGSGRYFSIDGGTTSLAVFNSGGGDKQDFNGANPTDPFNASTGPNQGHSLNGVDITSLDVIGYDLAQQAATSAVPEPATLTLFGVVGAGFALFGLRRRRVQAPLLAS